MTHAAPLHTPAVTRRDAQERGAVIIWAMVVVFMIGAVVLAGTDDVQALNKMMEASYEHEALASEVGQAGIVDAYAWFRRQPVQPVSNFAPALDLGAATPINETDDPSVGLVRTYEITPGLWARYEVKKGVSSESFTDTNGNGVWDPSEDFTDTDGDGRWTAAKETLDVSTERGLAGSGTVWKIESTGTIFRRSRADLPLGVGPNRRVAQTKLATEIRRLTIAPPASAAICCTKGSDVSLGNRARVRSPGGTTIAYKSASGSPNVGGAELDGIQTSMPSYEPQVDSMFGVGWAELRSMADTSTEDGVNGIPKKLPDYSMTMVSDDLVFNKSRPLRGTGLLVVQGDLTIDAGSNSFFSGVLYVKGDLTVRAPAYIRGTIVVDGKVDVRGTGGDYAEIEYDPSAIQTLMKKMGQYRITKSPHRVLPKLPDGRPTEARPGQMGFVPPLPPLPTGPTVPVGPTTPASVPTAPTAPTTPKVPTDPMAGKGFAVDGLIDALEDFLLANPSSAARREIEKALSDLRVAQLAMAKDPQDVKKAVNSTRKAMTDLIKALDRDDAFTATAFRSELDGGASTLIPRMQDMIGQMLAVSDAPQTTRDVAQGFYDAALPKLDRARSRMDAGNEVGGLKDYRTALNNFKKAVDQLDDYGTIEVSVGVSVGDTSVGASVSIGG